MSYLNRTRGLQSVAPTISIFEALRQAARLNASATLPLSRILLVEQLYSDLSVLAPFSVPDSGVLFGCPSFQQWACVLRPDSSGGRCRVACFLSALNLSHHETCVSLYVRFEVCKAANLATHKTELSAYRSPVR